MDTKIRIVDIAKKAGVSKGTVDRVLHKRGNVSADAKTKVLAAMNELNYKPNLIASALASNNIWRIAAFVPSYDNDPFWLQPKQGIERALTAVRDYGIQVDFFNFKDADRIDFKQKGETILKGNYNAVVIAPIFAAESHEFLDKLQHQNIKFIQINTFLERTEDNFLCYIGQNSYSSGKLAAQLLGYSLNDGETAMVLHLEKAVSNSMHLLDKERGFNDFFDNNSQKDIKVIKAVFDDVFNKVALENFIQDIIIQHPNLKGIFITTSKIFHIIPILEKLSIQHINLVGFDLIEENLHYLKENKICFLINQNPLKQGYLSIVSLFHHFIRKQELPKYQYLPLEVVVHTNMEYYLEEEEEKVALIL